MTRVTAVLLFITVVVTDSRVQAAIHQVPADFSTIQAAIDAAAAGDIVVVAPGLYAEALQFRGRDITLTSVDPQDAEVVAGTVLSLPVAGRQRGGGQPVKSSVVFFHQGETPASILSGFTIQGGFGTRAPEFESPQIPTQIYIGGGVYCQNASPTIIRNHFQNNLGAESDTEEGYGGAVGCYNSDAVIVNNMFTDNRALLGGAMITIGGDPLIANNLFVDNSALLAGGLYLLGGRFLNNTLVGNRADQGIGHLLVQPFTAEQPAILIQNNIFSHSPSGGGILIGEGVPGDWFAYNDVWGNEPVDFVDVSLLDQGTFEPDSRQWIGGFGNIGEDPQYSDISNRDFRLRDESPCINAGDPDLDVAFMETDLDGLARNFGGRVDMGAYELGLLTRPLADAGADQEVFTGTLVTLDGSGSLFPDPNNPTRIYLWDQLEGPSAELNDPRLPQPTFDALGEGVYRFELIVYDGEHVSQPDETIVTVTDRRRGE